ncbi:HAD-IC family P-type ATPase, partial [Streptomyces rishiriensis]
MIRGEIAVVGSPTFLREHGIAVEGADDGGQTDSGAETAVLVAHGGRLLGRIGLSDAIKPGARTAIAALHRQGMKTVLLTGDTRTAAEHTAERLGIDTVISGVLPADKAGTIRDLQARGERVAMVGDGINDAVALAAADLGLAVVSGTDIALKSADIILVRDDLAVIPDAIGLSRRTLRTIKTNLGWAFGYNIAAIPIAAAGLLNPLIAAAAMALSSVLVVYNSLRLQNFRRAD